MRSRDNAVRNVGAGRDFKGVCEALSSRVFMHARKERKTEQRSECDGGIEDKGARVAARERH